MARSFIVTREIVCDEAEVAEKIESYRREGYDILERVGRVVSPTPDRPRPRRKVSPYPQRIDDAIRDAKARTGQSLQQLCVYLGVSAPTVIAWLSGEDSPTCEQWERLRGVKYWSRKPLPQEKVEEIRRVHKECGDLAEVAARCGVSTDSVRKYVG